MDSLNFLNLIYFIRDLLMSLIFHDKNELSNKVIKLESNSSIDDAINYYSSDPQGLYNSIMSSDISVLVMSTSFRNMKEYTLVLRRMSEVIANKQRLSSMVGAEKHDIYVRNFLKEECDGDIYSSLRAFYSVSKRFLIAYKGLNTRDVNHRLMGTLAENSIHIKEIFAGLEFSDINLD